MQKGFFARQAVKGALFMAATMLSCASFAQAASADFPKPQGALADSLAALSSAWNTSGLAFTTATFAEAPAKGYGQYTPRGSTSFSAGEPLTIYAEPVGYGFSASEAGYSYSLQASFRLLNTTGQVLAAQDGFADFSGTTRSAKRELPASLSFRFSGLPAGDYTLETTFTDKIGDKSGTISLPFTIAAGQ